MSVLSGFNPSVSRHDWKSAARLFKLLWPEPRISRACATVLAASIRAAHKAGEDSWEVTMFANFIRFNVGQVEALILRKDGAKFVFRAPLKLPRGHSFEVYIPPGGKPIYPAVPVPTGVCVVHPSSLPFLPPALRDAHIAFIQAAAARKTVSPWKGAFSPAVVEYVEREIGTRLPRPGYVPQPPENPTAKDKITNTLETSAGFQSNSEIRKVVEHLAMDAAKRHLEDAGYTKIKDTSEFKPYDFTCQRNGRTWFVEVKGTQTTGDMVALTENEKTHAERYPNNSILFLLHSIKVRMGKEVEASGGEARILEPWDISRGTLRSTAWIFKLSE